MFNVILSSSECKYGVGNLIHFVYTGSNLSLGRHINEDGNEDGFFVTNEEGITFYGYDLILFPKGDFFYLDQEGKWFSHSECKQIDLFPRMKLCKNPLEEEKGEACEDCLAPVPEGEDIHGHCEDCWDKLQS